MKIFSWLMLPCSLLLITSSPLVAAAQTVAPSAPVWTMQDSGTTASLRGIHSVDGKIAWASGSGGTVLRTVDGGEHWIKCEIPDGKKDGAKLDFRGVQAWDEKTAIVMASGPGELSRTYKTTNGCKTWGLLQQNDEKDGFWDAIQMWTPTDGFLAGDPVHSHLLLTESTSYWGGFIDDLSYELKTIGKGEAAFAASNSCIALGSFNTKDGTSRDVWFATGGSDGSRVLHYQHFNGGEPERQSLSISKLNMFPKTKSGGVFSIYFIENRIGIVVGGDYTKPNESAGTAAWSTEGGQAWTATEKPPHGYRSTVQWSEALKIWITAGTNGSDVSRDDGKTWTPLDDGNWNALSLPFIVGPNGRIGRLNENAIPPVNPQAAAPAR